MDTLIAVNQIVHNEEERINQRLKEEAVAVWNTGRTGYTILPLYINIYLTTEWNEMVRLN